MRIKLMKGDNILLLKELEDNSIDSIVTDPPYGLNFMGKKWDYEVPSIEFWKECLRVLKPGGHVLSFGGTRTYHRMVINIEDAGFEIRDQIQWLYGSGFPKSHNIGKAFDTVMQKIGETNTSGDYERTKGESKFEGWGTALKPANEPICLARKPLSEKTIIDNCIKWGTGGMNIDGCRVGFDPSDTNPATNPLYRFQNERYKQVTDHGQSTGENVSFTNSMNPPNEHGRFPANIILDEDAGMMLGEPSRFFYCAKVSKKERNLGLEEFEATKKNTHPTIKPIKLMRYLQRLITPVGGITLDPFMGSGSSGISAQLEGFDFIGMELEEDYFDIAEARIKKWKEYENEHNNIKR